MPRFYVPRENPQPTVMEMMRLASGSAKTKSIRKIGFKDNDFGAILLLREDYRKQIRLHNMPDDLATYYESYRYFGYSAIIDAWRDGKTAKAAHKYHKANAISVYKGLLNAQEKRLAKRQKRIERHQLNGMGGRI